jgi:hypothetical protein
VDVQIRDQALNSLVRIPNVVRVHHSHGMLPRYAQAPLEQQFALLQ